MKNKIDLTKIPLWLLALLGLLYFTALLGTHSLVTPDEGRYPDVARVMLQNGDWIVPRLNGVSFWHKPILYYWLEMLSMKCFGINPWAIRLPGALTGLFGCIFLYQAGKRLFDEESARLGALILAANPLYFFGSQFADMNLEVGVFISAAILSFFVAEKGKTGHPLSWRLLAWFFMGLAILTKGLMGIVLPMMVVGLWVLIFNQWRRIPYFGFVRGGLILLAVIAPWFYLMEKEQPGFLNYFVVIQHFQRFAGSNFNNEAPWWYYIAVLAFGVMPWISSLPGAIQRMPMTRAAFDMQMPVVLLVWVFSILVFFSIPVSKIGGYILPVVPALCLLLAIDLRNWHEIGKFRKTVFTLFLIVIWLGVAYLAFVREPELTPAVILAFLLASAITLVGAGVVWNLKQEARLETGKIAAFMIAFNLSYVLIVPVFVHHDEVKISAMIAKHLNPQDEIIFYQKYFYDIPIYTNYQKPVTVVEQWNNPALEFREGWRNQIWDGKRRMPESDQWLILPDEFPQRVAEAEISNRRLFIVSDQFFCKRLTDNYPVRIILTDNETCLLINNSASL